MPGTAKKRSGNVSSRKSERMKRRQRILISREKMFENADIPVVKTIADLSVGSYFVFPEKASSQTKVKRKRPKRPKKK